MAKIQPRRRPTFKLEADAIAQGHGPVAGIDEAGRGPWAGPVVAAAVILDPAAIPDGLTCGNCGETTMFFRMEDTVFCGSCAKAVDTVRPLCMLCVWSHHCVVYVCSAVVRACWR